jgi:polyribonucleotide nucleotidyltransferase
MDTKIYTLDLEGKTITATFSNLVDQAGGAVMLSSGGTVVLATACMSKDGKNNPGFFNLTVEYVERNYAAGLILGGQYNKREGRPSDEAVLSSRIIDRTIRPFFETHIKNAVQVVVTVLSLGEMDPAVLGINAVSLALSVSPIPWNGPVGAVLVGKLKGKEGIEVNPYAPNTGETPYDLDVTVCGTDGKICMIEALAFEYTEDQMKDIFETAMRAITTIENWQKGIIAEMGKEKIVIVKPELGDEYKAIWKDEFEAVVPQYIFGTESKKYIYAYEDMWMDKIKTMTEDAGVLATARDFYHHHIDEFLHVGALTENKRADGRTLTQVRALFGQVGGISDRLHGTGIFYRGETHVLSVLTLGGPETQTSIDGMEVRGSKRFSHHYNFAPYSVGEAGRMGATNRREMGHGFLVEKALTPVIPSKDTFPYTIRVVSECMASNGSTSQASVCAGVLALMDGGVPITKPVAGISVGLMLNEKDVTQYKLLTDIQGPEDHHGDMDFKVAGTKDGITAMQLDIKVGGIPVPILCDALEKAREAREEILKTMFAVIETPRDHISKHAPHIIHMNIQPDQIGMVIGGGGKTIKMMKEKTGAEITIEDSGDVFITGTPEGTAQVKEMIGAMTKEWVVNDRAFGTVVKILEIGAIVSISPFADGLVHISEIAPFRVMKVTDVLSEGMTVPVVVTAVDKDRDKISLSIKQADSAFIKKPASYEVAHTPAQTTTGVHTPEVK